MVGLQGEEKQQYVADLFSRIARRYDLMNDLMTAGLHRRWKGQTAQLTAEGLAGRALDVATGTGDLALALSKRPGIDCVVGVDLLPEMATLARHKTAAGNRGAHLGLLLGDALRLPFADGSFACVTAGFSLRNMPDLDRALAEMARVAQPGGRVTTLELTPLPPGLQSRLIRWYFHRLTPLMGRVVARDRSAYTYLPDSVDVFPEAEELAGLLRKVGLVDVGYRRMGFGAVALHWGRRPLAEERP